MASRNHPLYLLSALQLLVCLAATGYAWWAAPALLADYRRHGDPLSVLAQLALAGWPLLLVCWLAFAVVMVALLRKGKRGARLRQMAIALTVSAAAFVVLAMASVLPLLG